MIQQPPSIIAISGSTRSESFTTQALTHTLDAAEAVGATTELIELAESDIPMFRPEIEAHSDVEAIRNRIAAADAILLGTPMYHGSYSSPLKTILDYSSADHFGDKTVGLLAVSGGAFPLTALNHLRDIARSLGSWVLPHQVAIPNVDSAFDRLGDPNPDIAERITVLGEQLYEYASIEPSRVATDCPPEEITVE